MSRLGSKADNLVRLRDEFRVPVPAFIATEFALLIHDFSSVAAKLENITTSYLEGETAEATALRSVARIVAGLSINADGVRDLYKLLDEQCWERVSYRTSALNEDGAEHSFAGQYESFVDKRFSRATLKKYALACFASTVTERVLRYAKARGLTRFDVGGSLIVQEMFYGAKSGVLFSEDGTRHMLVSFNESWRNTVVEGDASQSLRISKGAVQSGVIPREFRQLAQVALQLESAIGAPVDVEWALKGDELALLQFRPQTTAFRDYVLSWDSTNIAENYPGVTLPLTYSFIRTLYARVYPSFFKLMGTSARKLEAYAPVFDNMLGYVDGHVYYRISNWYEVVALIPGKKNQLYFEAMLNPVKKRGDAAHSRLDVGSVVALARFLGLLLSSERYSRRFKRLISKKLTEYELVYWEYVQNAAIIESVKQIRSDLLAAWATPILNDIRVMVFHGILRTAFFGPKHQESYLRFLQGLTDRASIRPLLALTELGAAAKNALRSAGVDSISSLRGTAEWESLARAVEGYSAEYGARTPDELKLESERLTDSTEEVLALALKAADTPVQTVEERRLSWPAHVPVLMRPALWYVANTTRRAIDWRERFRFNRAQVFNVARQAFLAIGESFTREGLIDTPRDIFWLTEQEIDEIVNGHAWSYTPASRIAERKANHESYAASAVGTGLQGAGEVASLHVSEVKAATDGHAKVSGSGVAPGEITAEVIIATEFDATLDVRGKILVTGHIDPGWTLLFTQAAGIITERGNALSHAAIIAREIGIPAIVAVKGATTLLKDGQRITMNGVTGELREATH